MKTKILYLALFFAGILSFSSCSLDEDNPSGGDAVITNYDTWYGLQVYCYSSLTEELFRAYDFLSVAEGGTDMWLTPGSNPDYAMQLIYYEGLTISTNATNKLFKQAYASIGTCNAVIHHADEVTGGSEENIATLTAETKVLRAFYNLLLVTYYGPVTLSENEPDAADTNPTRNTIEEFYTSITTDLQEAADVLDTEPFEGNYARVTKKTALGLLARAYAQGAGEGLYEDGVSYWQRAKEVAEDIISNASSYGVYLYDDVSDLWAQDNNRDNPEALFIVAGYDANTEASNYVSAAKNLFTYTMCNPYKCSDIYTVADNANYYLGRVNNNTFAPSQYSISVFDPSWDKRWENTFMTAFGMFSMAETGTKTYSNARLRITPTLISKYGMGEDYKGSYVYPYVEINDSKTGDVSGTSQYIPTGVWPKGETSGDLSALEESKNVLVIDYPIDEDDNRFSIVLWPGSLQGGEDKTADDKAKSIYFTVNISDLFDGDQYRTSQFDGTNSYALYPSFIKYNWNYDGVHGTSLQRRNGDMAIMRTAEVYLIAAEACQQLGETTKAANYLQVLRDRAAREGTTAPTLTSVDEETIFDEYARELAGEYQRWPLLKRHRAIGSRVALYNSRAAEYFDEDIHYCRPISSDFLEQIDNADEYGDNGYGTTAIKGY